MRLNTRFIAIIITAILSLSGCGDFAVSTYTICNEHQQLCQDIETEGWCKNERVDLISNRYKIKKTPDDQDNQYRALVSWRDFSQCIMIASNVTRKTISDRTSKKARAYLTSLSEIKTIERLTINSHYPQLLYYHWSQHHDPIKLEKLLALDNQQQLKTTELQLMMASYYAKVDPKKQMIAQYKALSYLDPDDSESVDMNLYATIATSFYQQKQYKLAYVWSMVAERSGMKASSSSLLLQHLNAKSVNLKKLQRIAEQTLDSIESHQFVKPESRF